MPDPPEPTTRQRENPALLGRRDHGAASTEPLLGSPLACSAVRRLVACCDGTWDTPADRTDVSLVAGALAESPDQVVRYFGGVGTGTDPVTRLLQGGLGLGLNTRVREACTWLAQTWRPGDEIVLPGSLYAAANDSWVGYGGDRGAVTLTVTRS